MSATAAPVKSNAQVDWTNKAVDEYNALLRKDCDAK